MSQHAARWAAHSGCEVFCESGVEYSSLLPALASMLCLASLTSESAHQLQQRLVGRQAWQLMSVTPHLFLCLHVSC
jgi:hypothetical protein